MAGDEGPFVTKSGKVLTEDDLDKLAAEAGRGYDVLGADATACCLWHHKLAVWIPAPGWWIHEHGYCNSRGAGFSDPRTCPGMWNLPEPIVLVPVPAPEEDT